MPQLGGDVCESTMEVLVRLSDTVSDELIGCQAVKVAKVGLLGVPLLAPAIACRQQST